MLACRLPLSAQAQLANEREALKIGMAIARRCAPVRDGEALDDWASDVRFGVAQALATYRGDRAAFSTWLGCKVRGEVLQGRRDRQWLSRYEAAKNDAESRLLPGVRQEPVSLETRVSLDGEGECFLLDALVSASDPETEALTARERDIVARALLDLPDRWRYVVQRYFWDGMTYLQISRELGVSESRVFQIAGQSLQRLRLILGDAL